MIKVLILQSPSNDGCTWYRLTQFAKKAKELGLADVQFIDVNLSEHTLGKVIEAADCYLVRLSDFTATEILDIIKDTGTKKPVVLDIDDNYECVHPLSDMYQVYGTQDVKLGDGSWLHKSGEKDFDTVANSQRLEKFKEVMREATAVITTTFELKNYAEQYNKAAVIIPNVINPDLYPPLSLTKDKAIRIVWAGGASHYPDLAEVKTQLVRLMREYPQLEFHMLGTPFAAILKDMPKHRVKTYGWINADGHSYRLLCTRGDIGICPLLEMPFNRYKSSVKFYEYSSANMATLAKNMPPYSDDIVAGKTGLLYDDPRDFYEKMKQLIENPIERLQLAREAKDYVFTQRNLNEITKDWVGFLEGLVSLTRRQYAGV